MGYQNEMAIARDSVYRLILHQNQSEDKDQTRFRRLFVARNIKCVPMQLESAKANTADKAMQQPYSRRHSFQR